MNKTSLAYFDYFKGCFCVRSFVHLLRFFSVFWNDGASLGAEMQEYLPPDVVQQLACFNSHLLHSSDEWLRCQNFTGFVGTITIAC
jgi:hypothetical protein